MSDNNIQDQSLASTVEVAVKETGNFDLFWEKRSVWLTIQLNEWQNVVFTLYAYTIEEEFDNDLDGIDIKKFFKAIDVVKIEFLTADQTINADLALFPDTIDLVKSLATHTTVVDIYNGYMELISSVHNMGEK